MNIIREIDCVEGTAQLEDESIDMVVTSPPFGTMRRYERGELFDLNALAMELHRVIRTGGVIAWEIRDQIRGGNRIYASHDHVRAFRGAGFLNWDHMIAARVGSLPDYHSHPRYPCEWANLLVFSKGKPKTWNPIMIPCSTAGSSTAHVKRRRRDGTREERPGGPVKSHRVHPNLFTYHVGYRKSTTDSWVFGQHPAIMPERLAADMIQTWTDEGDLVLDPFAGSGTVLKMAAQMKRRWIGFDTAYTEVAMARLAPFERRYAWARHWFDDADDELSRHRPRDPR
jgi:site-specific DNA-methyltransferase (adenine-specific)